MALDAMLRPSHGTGIAWSNVLDSSAAKSSTNWFENSAALSGVNATCVGHFVRTAWFLVVACIVQWPYRSACHVSDDRYLQFLIGLLQTGRIGWANYLFQPLEGHFVPFWKLIYFVQWRVYGLDAVPWHFNITLVHVASVCLLYWLLERYLKSWPAALFGATIWAAAAIGRWDNPFSWLATGQIPWSTMWLLAAMVCQSLAVEKNRRRWMLGGTLCYAAAVLTWGASLALGFVFPLQLWLLEPVERGSNHKRGVFIYWVASFCVLSAVTVTALIPQLVASETQRSVPEFGEGMSRIVGQLSVTFASSTVWGYATDSTVGLTPKRIAAAVVFLFVFILPTANRRLLAVFVGLTLVHLALVNVFRADVGIQAALGWGRYLYFATMAWAVVAAVALDALLSLVRSSAAWWLIVAVGCLIPFYVGHQYRIASDTMDDFFSFYDEERAHFNRQLELMRWVDDQAAASNSRLTLLDIPVQIPPTKDIYFPLSAFVAVALPEGLKNVQIVRGDDARDIELDKAKEMLERSANPLVSQWIIQMDRTSELLGKLAWLSETVETSETTFEIPDKKVVSSPLSFPMKHLIGMHYPQGLPGCMVVPVSESPATELPESSDGQASWWNSVFSSDSPIVIEGE